MKVNLLLSRNVLDRKITYIIPKLPVPGCLKDLSDTRAKQPSEKKIIR